MPEVVSHGASWLGVIAHTAALRDGQDWLAEHLAGLDAQRRLLGELLAERLPAVGYRMPAATYLAWLDCRPLGLPDEPASFFLEHARVALNAGPDFGRSGAGRVRLNFATSTAVLTEAVDRMAAAVRRVRSGSPSSNSTGGAALG
jgi:cystathionine beta-lyase